MRDSRTLMSIANRARGRVALGVALVLILLALPAAAPLAGDDQPAARQLSLAEAQELALANNESIALARLARSKAKYGLELAELAAYRIPEGGFPAPADEQIKALKQKFVGPRQAEMAVLLAEKGYLAAVESLKYNVEKSYYDLLKAQDLVRIGQVSLDRARKQLTQAQAMFASGTAARNDVLSAEVMVANAEAALISGEKARAVAEMALNRIVGLDLDTPLLLTSRAEKTDPGNIDVEQAVADALRRRLDMLQARQNVEIRELELRVTGRLYTPGHYQYKMDEIAIEEARLQLAKVEQDTELAVKAAYLGIEEAARRIPVAEKALEQARESLRLAELRYKAGVTTVLEVTSAQAVLTQAEAQAVQVLYDYNLAVAGFRLVSGEGLD